MKKGDIFWFLVDIFVLFASRLLTFESCLSLNLKRSWVSMASRLGWPMCLSKTGRKKALLMGMSTKMNQSCSQVGVAGSELAVNKFEVFRYAFWSFLRPLAIRGTTLGLVSLVTRAILENPNLIRWSLLFKAFFGLLALICGNG